MTGRRPGRLGLGQSSTVRRCHPACPECRGDWPWCIEGSVREGSLQFTRQESPAELNAKVRTRAAVQHSMYPGSRDTQQWSIPEQMLSEPTQDLGVLILKWGLPAVALPLRHYQLVGNAGFPQPRNHQL